jgi:hypothetical protein
MHWHRPGTVVGKALESLPSGEGGDPGPVVDAVNSCYPFVQMHHATFLRYAFYGYYAG